MFENSSNCVISEFMSISYHFPLGIWTHLPSFFVWQVIFYCILDIMSVTLCRLWVLLKSSGECLFKQAVNLVKFRLQVSSSLLWVKVPVSVQLSKPALCCSGPVLNMQHSWVHLRLGQCFTSQTSRQSCCCAASGKPKGLRWFIHKILGVTFSSSPFFPSPLTFQSTESPFLSSLDQKDGVSIRVLATQNTATRRKRQGRPDSSLPCRFLFSKSWFPAPLLTFTVLEYFLFVFHREWRWAGAGLRRQRWTSTLPPCLWRVSWGVLLPLGILFWTSS